jgi:hypothetical protein
MMFRFGTLFKLMDGIDRYKNHAAKAAFSWLFGVPRMRLPNRNGRMEGGFTSISGRAVMAFR